MARRLLILGVVLASGCIVPISLQQQEAPENFRPSFVAEQIDPPLQHRLTPATSMTDTPLHVVADDPNLDDELFVRLFRPQGMQLVMLLVPPTKLVSSDVSHPERRSGDVPPPGMSVPFCSSFFNSTSLTTEITIVVADRPFSDTPGLQDTAPGGLTTRAGWTLVCP